MWFNWMGIVSRRNGSVPGLPPLENRIYQDSQYDITKFIVSYDYTKHIGFLKNDNTTKFTKRRLFVKKFIIESFIFCILIVLVMLFVAIGFKHSSVGKILVWAFIGLFLGTLIYYFLYVNFAIVLYYKKLYGKYHKYFELLLKNNCISNDINLYPTSLKMSLVSKEEYMQKYSNYNFPQFQHVSATWALCIFIDKLNTINPMLETNKNNITTH